MARAGKGLYRRPRQSVKKCPLLRKASSCLNDASYDEEKDVASVTDDITTATTTTTSPQPRPFKIPRRSSLSSSSVSSSSHQAVQPPSATRTATHAKPSPQPQSPFFTNLPVEIRRLIYDQLFRSTNSLMKMHIHAACDGARLTTTPCQYHPSATYSTRDDEADPMQTDPWPGWRGRNQPPRWFWHAWGLRLRWGPHWKCQAAAMLDWKTREDGTSVDLKGRRGGWMGMFLSCRQMYAEAIEYCFESTSLVFTASEDVFRFLLQNPHAHMSRIHDLDLTFNHFKDHLFLQRIESKHPHLPNGSHVPVAKELWRSLTACLRERLPELRNLRIHLSPPSAANEGQIFADLLREWERDGHGWVEDQVDGIVYLEKGRKKGRLLLEEDGDTSGPREGGSLSG